MNYIVGYENWRQAYGRDDDRQRIWVHFETSDGKHLYLNEYKKWLTVQEYIDKNNVTITKVGLKYRSHEVSTDVDGASAVYVVKSVKGELHGETLQCYTIGLLKDDGKMHKTMWITPALVEDIISVDDLEECFEEAIVYNVRQSETV